MFEKALSNGDKFYLVTKGYLQDEKKFISIDHHTIDIHCRGCFLYTDSSWE